MHILNVHGVKVPVKDGDISPVIWQSIVSGSYEAKEAKRVAAVVKPNDRVLELGSGLSVITTLISRIEGVKVWAVEANPTTVDLGQRVLAANGVGNVALTQGLLTAGPATEYTFYVRKDLWMSSLDQNQGPYEQAITLASSNIDDFIADHAINVLFMDIEGAERDLLVGAELTGIQRIFIELHDHLYGLDGIRRITQALALRGFAYDPRASFGSCVLFAQDDGPREFQSEASNENFK
ncbi:methyltransferase, FkbM family [Devosia sp. LC5]|uniref:FkbM family methyltransferase n=1 Tax=Devosia sp. LC5 TaxID=1502724 RepID=UPI0004E43137|nr:FkbM family methyltransferase [Devosia sp. LC5]KFC70184.1 methyltransferase, FkbM family [Devosia sp. LC5]